MCERGEHTQQLFEDFMHKTDAHHLWRSCFPKHIKCLCIGSLRVGEFKMYIEQRHCQHRIGDVLLIVMCEVANLQFEALHARLSLHACDNSLFFARFFRLHKFFGPACDLVRNLPVIKRGC